MFTIWHGIQKFAYVPWKLTVWKTIFLINAHLQPLLFAKVDNNPSSTVETSSPPQMSLGAVSDIHTELRNNIDYNRDHL